MENKKLTLQEYVDKSGQNWILDNSETFYYYRYEEKTFEEWENIFN